MPRTASQPKPTRPCAMRQDFFPLMLLASVAPTYFADADDSAIHADRENWLANNQTRITKDVMRCCDKRIHSAAEMDIKAKELIRELDLKRELKEKRPPGAAKLIRSRPCEICGKTMRNRGHETNRHYQTHLLVSPVSIYGKPGSGTLNSSRASGDVQIVHMLVFRGQIWCRIARQNGSMSHNMSFTSLTPELTCHQ